jgi:Seryl-tRNA synthetase N-terminal domain
MSCCLRLVPRFSRLHLHKQVLRSGYRNVGTQAVASAETLEGKATPDLSAYPQVPFRSAIDYKYIVENVEKLKANAVNRKSNADPEKVAELYAQFLALTGETDALRKQRNDNAKAMKVCAD